MTNLCSCRLNPSPGHACDVPSCVLQRPTCRHLPRQSQTVLLTNRKSASTIRIYQGALTAVFIRRTVTPQSNMAAAVALAARSRAERLSQSKAESTAGARTIPENSEVGILNIGTILLILMPLTRKKRVRIGLNFLEMPLASNEIIIDEVKSLMRNS